MALRGQERNGDALAILERLADTSPDNANVVAHLVAALHAEKRFDDAINTARRGIDRWPDHTALRGAVGWLQPEMDAAALALGNFDRALELEPDGLEHLAGARRSLNAARPPCGCC